MKEKRLLEALGKVDEKYIEEASPVQYAKKIKLLKWGAIAACICLVIGAFAIPHLFSNPQAEVATIDSLEEIASSYGGNMLAERLTTSGAKTTSIRLSYDKGGDISNPTTWNTLSITGEYNGRGFTLNCDFANEGDKKDPTEAYTVTQYGNVEVTIYREESEWDDLYLYRAEFILDSVAYSLSIHSDALEDLYAYLNIVLGESEGYGNQSGATLTDVMGFGVCRVEMEELTPNQYRWHYYVKIDGKDICVAEQFGYDGPEAWSRDLDGDGVPELICNCTYGDGLQNVVVYRNNNGIIEEGNIRLSYYEEKFGWAHLGESGIFSLPVERYNPEKDVFTATDYYTHGYDDSVTVEFDDGLEPFEFFPFDHLPL